MKNVRVIAELGVNWDTVETAKEWIEKAKEVGCDYVKFQMYNEDVVAGIEGRSMSLPNLQEKLLARMLTEDKVATLEAHAKKHSLGFIISVMYEDAIDIAAKYCDYIKIRYADHENTSLIKKAQDTGKILLISVPSKPIDLEKMYSPRIRYMHCIPKYPPKVQDFNLEIACTCQGFSSHYPHIVCDLAYVINRNYAECFIEKHVMSKTFLERARALWQASGGKTDILPIDSRASVTFEQMKTLVSYIKLAEKMQRIRL